MLLLTGARRLSRACCTPLRAARTRPRPALPCAVPVPADGAQRRLPDRRPVQPVRVLRGAADRLLRPAAARRRRPRGCAPRCTTSWSTWSAPSLFLIAVGLLYGVTGTLNMADLARCSCRALPAPDAGAGAGRARCCCSSCSRVKAALLPLDFWLPRHLRRGRRRRWPRCSPIMTKVGVYALLGSTADVRPASRRAGGRRALAADARARTLVSGALGDPGCGAILCGIGFTMSSAHRLSRVRKHGRPAR